VSWALLAHLLLAGALTWGVSWNRQAPVTTVEAELWSALPQQAAPKLQEVPQPPPAPPVVTPEPPPVKAPQITVEKEKPKPPKPETRPEPKTEVKPNKIEQDKKLTKQQEEERQKFLNRSAELAGATGTPNVTGQAKQSASI
jgi:colicin import membrane protein